MTHQLSKNGIFASLEDKKKAYLLLSFIFIVTTAMAIMTEVLPKGSNITPSFILDFYVMSTGLILAYSLFSKKRSIVVPVSGAVAFLSVIFFICNLYANYEKDYQGSNARLPIAVVIVVMLAASLIRWRQYKRRPKS